MMAPRPMTEAEMRVTQAGIEVQKFNGLDFSEQYQDIFSKPDYQKFGWNLDSLGDIKKFRTAMGVYMEKDRVQLVQDHSVDIFNTIMEGITTAERIEDRYDKLIFGRDVNSKVTDELGNSISVMRRIENNIKQAESNIKRLNSIEIVYDPKSAKRVQIEQARLKILQGLLVYELGQRVKILEESKVKTDSVSPFGFISTVVQGYTNKTGESGPIVVDKKFNEDKARQAIAKSAKRDFSQLKYSQTQQNMNEALDDNEEVPILKTGMDTIVDEDGNMIDVPYDEENIENIEEKPVDLDQEFKKQVKQMKIGKVKTQKFGKEQMIILQQDTGKKQIDIMAPKHLAMPFMRDTPKTYERELASAISTTEKSKLKRKLKIRDKNYYTPDELLAIMSSNRFAQELHYIFQDRFVKNDKKVMSFVDRKVTQLLNTGNSNLDVQLHTLSFDNQIRDRFAVTRPMEYLFMGSVIELRNSHLPIYTGPYQDENLKKAIAGPMLQRHVSMYKAMETFDDDVKFKNMSERLWQRRLSAVPLFTETDIALRPQTDSKLEYLVEISKRKMAEFLDAKTFPKQYNEFGPDHVKGQYHWFKRLSNTFVPVTRGAYEYAIGQGVKFSSREAGPDLTTGFIRLANDDYLKAIGSEYEEDKPGGGKFTMNKFLSEPDNVARIYDKLGRLTRQMKLFADLTIKTGNKKTAFYAMSDKIVEQLRDNAVKSYFTPDQALRIERLAREATFLEQSMPFENVSIKNGYDKKMVSDDEMPVAERFTFDEIDMTDKQGRDKPMSLANFKSALLVALAEDVASFYEEEHTTQLFHAMMASLDQETQWQSNKELRTQPAAKFIIGNPLTKITGKEMFSDYLSQLNNYMSKLYNDSGNFVSIALRKGSGRYKKDYQQFVMSPFVYRTGKIKYDFEQWLVTDDPREPDAEEFRTKQLLRISPYLKEPIDVAQIAEVGELSSLKFTPAFTGPNQLTTIKRSIDLMDLIFGAESAFKRAITLFDREEDFYGKQFRQEADQLRLAPDWSDLYLKVTLQKDKIDLERLRQGSNVVQQKVDSFNPRWNMLMADPVLYGRFKQMLFESQERGILTAGAVTEMARGKKGYYKKGDRVLEHYHKPVEGIAPWYNDAVQKTRDRDPADLLELATRRDKLLHKVYRSYKLQSVGNDDLLEPEVQQYIEDQFHLMKNKYKLPELQMMGLANLDVLAADEGFTAALEVEDAEQQLAQGESLIERIRAAVGVGSKRTRNADEDKEEEEIKESLPERRRVRIRRDQENPQVQTMDDTEKVINLFENTEQTDMKGVQEEKPQLPVELAAVPLQVVGVDDRNEEQKQTVVASEIAQTVNEVEKAEQMEEIKQEVALVEADKSEAFIDKSDVSQAPPQQQLAVPNSVNQVAVPAPADNPVYNPNQDMGQKAVARQNPDGEGDADKVLCPICKKSVEPNDPCRQLRTMTACCAYYIHANCYMGFYNKHQAKTCPVCQTAAPGIQCTTADQKIIFNSSERMLVQPAVTVYEPDDDIAQLLELICLQKPNISFNQLHVIYSGRNPDETVSDNEMTFAGNDGDDMVVDNKSDTKQALNELDALKAQLMPPDQLKALTDKIADKIDTIMEETKVEAIRETDAAINKNQTKIITSVLATQPKVNTKQLMMQLEDSAAQVAPWSIQQKGKGLTADLLKELDDQHKVSLANAADSIANSERVSVVDFGTKYEAYQRGNVLIQEALTQDELQLALQHHQLGIMVTRHKNQISELMKVQEQLQEKMDTLDRQLLHHDVSNTKMSESMRDINNQAVYVRNYLRETGMTIKDSEEKIKTLRKTQEAILQNRDKIAHFLIEFKQQNNGESLKDFGNRTIQKVKDLQLVNAKLLEAQGTYKETKAMMPFASKLEQTIREFTQKNDSLQDMKRDFYRAIGTTDVIGFGFNLQKQTDEITDLRKKIDSVGDLAEQLRKVKESKRAMEKAGEVAKKLDHITAKLDDFKVVATKVDLASASNVELFKGIMKEVQTAKNQFKSFNIPEFDQVLKTLQDSINNRGNVDTTQLRSQLAALQGKLYETKDTLVKNQADTKLEVNRLKKQIDNASEARDQVVKNFRNLNILMKAKNIDDRFQLDLDYDKYADNFKKLTEVEALLSSESYRFQNEEQRLDIIFKQINSMISNRDESTSKLLQKMYEMVVSLRNMELNQTDLDKMREIGQDFESGALMNDKQKFNDTMTYFQDFIIRLRNDENQKQIAKKLTYNTILDLSKVMQDANKLQVDDVQFQVDLDGLMNELGKYGYTSINISRNEDVQSLSRKRAIAQQDLQTAKERVAQLTSEKNTITKVLGKVLKEYQNAEKQTAEFDSLVAEAKGRISEGFAKLKLDTSIVQTKTVSDLQKLEKVLIDKFDEEKDKITNFDAKMADLRTRTAMLHTQKRELDQQNKNLEYALSNQEEMKVKVAITQQLVKDLERKYTERETMMATYKRGQLTELCKAFDMDETKLQVIAGSVKDMDKYYNDSRKTITELQATVIDGILDGKSFKDFIEDNLMNSFTFKSYVSPPLVEIGKSYHTLNQVVLKEFLASASELIGVNESNQYLDLAPGKKDTRVKKLIEDVNSTYQSLRTAKAVSKELDFVEAMWLSQHATTKTPLTKDQIENENKVLGVTTEVSEVVNLLANLQQQLVSGKMRTLLIQTNIQEKIMSKIEGLNSKLQSMGMDKRTLKLRSKLRESIADSVDNITTTLKRQGVPVNNLPVPIVPRLQGLMQNMFDTAVVKFFQLGPSYDASTDAASLLQMLTDVDLQNATGANGTNLRKGLMKFFTLNFDEFKTGVVTKIADLTSRTHADLIQNMDRDTFKMFLENHDNASKVIDDLRSVGDVGRVQNEERKQKFKQIMDQVQKAHNNTLTHFKKIATDRNYFNSTSYSSLDNSKQRMMSKQLNIFGPDNIPLNTSTRETAAVGSLMFKNQFFSQAQAEIYSQRKEELPFTKQKLAEEKKRLNKQFLDADWLALRQRDSQEILKKVFKEVLPFFVLEIASTNNYKALCMPALYKNQNGAGLSLNNISMMDRQRLAMDMVRSAHKLLPAILAQPLSLNDQGLLVPDQVMIKLLAVEKLLEFSIDHIPDLGSLSVADKRELFKTNNASEAVYMGTVAEINTKYRGNFKQYLKKTWNEYKVLVQNLFTDSRAQISNEMELLDLLNIEIDNRSRGETQYDKYIKQKEELDKYEKQLYSSIQSQLFKVGLKSFFNNDQQSQEQVRRQVQSQVPRYYPQPPQGGQSQQRPMTGNEQARAQFQSKMNWQSQYQGQQPTMGNQQQQQAPGGNGYFMAYPNSQAAQNGNPKGDRLSNESIELANGVKRIKKTDIEFIKRIAYSGGELLIIDERTGQQRPLTNEENRRYITILSILVVFLYNEVVKDLSDAERKKAEQRLQKTYRTDEDNHPQDDLIKSINELTQKYFQQLQQQ